MMPAYHTVLSWFLTCILRDRPWAAVWDIALENILFPVETLYIRAYIRLLFYASICNSQCNHPLMVGMTMWSISGKCPIDLNTTSHLLTVRFSRNIFQITHCQMNWWGIITSWAAGWETAIRNGRWVLSLWLDNANIFMVHGDLQKLLLREFRWQTMRPLMGPPS